MTDLPASWQTDPTGRHDHRYWDGTRWTDHVADAGVAGHDPYAEADSMPSWPEPGAATAATSSEPDPDDADTTGVASAEAGTATSGWSRPSEPATPQPDGPAEASPVAGWAPAASSTAWSTDPDPTAVTSTSMESPTEVTPIVDQAAAPDGSNLAGIPGLGGGPPESVPPIGPDSSGGSGGTRRNLLIGVGLLVVVAVVAFLALSGDDDDSGSSAISARLADSLQEDSDLSNDDAGCVADHIVDHVGADRLKDVDFTSDTAPSGTLGTDFVEAYADAVRECDVSAGGAFPDGSTDSEVTIPDIGDLDAFRDLLADQYEHTLGLPRTKAECLADAMGEAVSKGQLDEQDAFGDFFDYLDSCDIELDEITSANP